MCFACILESRLSKERFDEVAELDMAAESIYQAKRAPSAESAEEKAMHGIIGVPVNSFYYRQFRCSNLEDAFARAKRGGL
jgi:hypothetical protein